MMRLAYDVITEPPQPFSKDKNAMVMAITTLRLYKLENPAYAEPLATIAGWAFMPARETRVRNECPV
jgi:hypothetical protein